MTFTISDIISHAGDALLDYDIESNDGEGYVSDTRVVKIGNNPDTDHLLITMDNGQRFIVRVESAE